MVWDYYNDNILKELIDVKTVISDAKLNHYQKQKQVKINRHFGVVDSGKQSKNGGETEEECFYKAEGRR